MFFALFSGCTKDPCSKNILGIYDGNFTFLSLEFYGKITISQSSKGDYQVLIEVELLNSGDNFIMVQLARVVVGLKSQYKMLLIKTAMVILLMGIFKLQTQN